MGLGYGLAWLRSRGRAESPAELLQLQTDFVAHVSHELRTPLTSIRGYVKLLLDGDTEPLTETQREFLSIVDANAGRLAGLISDLLDVEKMESGRVQLKRSPCELREILEECRVSFEGPARAKGLTFRVSGPDGPWGVDGDRTRLLQAFGNLVSNAIKYTEQGGVTVSVERADRSWRVHVADTGPGLSSEEALRLFRRFYRAPGGLASGQGGTGLGLFIARGFIEAHGGRIQVASEAGKGSVFSVTLPRAAAPARGLSRKDADVPEAGAGQARGRRLLLADPDPDLRLLIRRALERSGFQVDDVGGGQEAVVRTAGVRFDLVLLALELVDLPLQEVVRLVSDTGSPVLLLGNEEPSSELLSGLALKFVPKYRGLDTIVDEVRCLLEQPPKSRDPLS